MMNPSRFWGKDMVSALRAVRGSLGSDALILETRAVADQNGGGIEILAFSETASSETNNVTAFSPAARPNLISVSESDVVPAPAQIISIERGDMREELAALRSMLSWLAPGLNHTNRILKSLVTQGLNPEVMARLNDAIHDAEGADEREKTYRALIHLIPTGGQIPDEVDRLALIGPTGVGKSSSIIKLTVFESQRLQRRVGWLNLDHRRIASGDPLALYATILGARYETATDVKEAKRAWERLSDCDLVLVDTPGVTPRDEKAMRILHRMLQPMLGLRRALLLTASTNGADMAVWVRRYQRLEFGSLFFTKLDECCHFGPLINTALGSGYPLSYITLGQNMAGDIEAAKAEVLTSLLLSGSDNDA
jgi:flagellar biosynthesis protein FlhF